MYITPLATQTCSAELIGVNIERSSLEEVRESNLTLGANRMMSGFTEDSADPSGYDDAVFDSHMAPRSAASRIYFEEGNARMQEKYRKFRLKLSFGACDSRACKNVPV